MKKTITKKEECLKNYLENTYWKDRGMKQRNGKEKTVIGAKIVVSNRKEKMQITEFHKRKHYLQDQNQNQDQNQDKHRKG